MKEETALVLIRRGDKDIAIYVKAGEWHKIPKLDFIEDVEVFKPKTLEEFPPVSLSQASTQPFPIEASR